MSTTRERRELGMHCAIARSDFLNGVAIGVPAGLSALGLVQAQGGRAAFSANADGYPPLRAGLRGNYPAAVDEFDPIRQGKYTRLFISASDVQEAYDLVIVGAGISGL